VLTKYLKNYEGIVIFFNKMWVSLKRADYCVVAFGGSEKSQLIKKVKQ